MPEPEKEEYRMVQSGRPDKMEVLNVNYTDEKKLKVGNVGEQIQVYAEWGPFTFSVMTDFYHLSIAQECAWEFIELAKKFAVIEWAR